MAVVITEVIINKFEWWEDSIFLITKEGDMYRFCGNGDVKKNDFSFIINEFNHFLKHIPIYHSGYFPKSRNELVNLLKEIIPEIFL